MAAQNGGCTHAHQQPWCSCDAVRIGVALQKMVVRRGDHPSGPCFSSACELGPNRVHVERHVDYDHGQYLARPPPPLVPSIKHLPKRFKKKVKRGRRTKDQNDWDISQLVQKILALEPGGDIDGLLNHWTGRFNRKNFPILIQEMTMTGSLNHSDRVFNWMKHQELYRARADMYNDMMCLNIRHNQLDSARRLFKEMQESRCNPDVESYNVLINAYGRARHLQLASNAFDAMLTAGIAPSRQSYNNLISAYGSSGKWEYCLQLCKKMMDNGVGPDIVTHNILLSALRNGGEYDKAISYFHGMEARNFPLDLVTYNILMKCFSQVGQYGKAIDLFCRLRNSSYCKPNLVTFNTVMHIYGVCGRLSDAKSTFELMLAEGLAPDVVSYNTLIGVYSSAGLYKEAESVMSLMKEAGHRPNLVTYTSLVNAYGKSGQPERAEVIFGMIERHSLKPNTVSYNALISAYSWVGNFDDAMRVYDVMKSKKVRPNSVTICTLLTASGKGGYMEKIHDILLEAACHNIQLNTTLCNAALTALIGGGAYDSAEKLFVTMQTDGIRADSVTYFLLIKMSGLIGDHMQAHRLFDELCAGAAGLTVEACSELINIYAKKGMPCEAQAVYEKMKILGCCPNVVTFTSLLCAYGVKGLLREAVGVFEDMVAEGIVPDIVAYTALISTFNKNGYPEKAIELARSIQHEEVCQNEVFCMEILAACSKLRDWRTALDTFQKMQDAGTVATHQTVHHLLLVVGKSGQPEEMLKLYLKIKKLGFEPTSGIYETLLNCFAKAGRWRLCMEILGWFELARFKPSFQTYNIALACLNSKEQWRSYLDVYKEMKDAGYLPTKSMASTAEKASHLWEGVKYSCIRCLVLFDGSSLQWPPLMCRNVDLKIEPYRYVDLQKLVSDEGCTCWYLKQQAEIVRDNRFIPPGNWAQRVHHRERREFRLGHEHNKQSEIGRACLELQGLFPPYPPTSWLYSLAHIVFSSIGVRA
ncbi:hypothetical protein GOP47_0024307 [Adiantum capillus-veneris]|uniref:PROP1-like PPR domain-containing protein n=1 Tax=Adiantum capillus-veneris TaxID=13818 RepID=A0A9D4Z495_ADICA|nr:hypothetical protein GOP47_0024307 [Adiantum capillus-veneris]